MLFLINLIIIVENNYFNLYIDLEWIVKKIK